MSEHKEESSINYYDQLRKANVKFIKVRYCDSKTVEEMGIDVFKNMNSALANNILSDAREKSRDDNGKFTNQYNIYFPRLSIRYHKELTKLFGDITNTTIPEGSNYKLMIKLKSVLDIGILVYYNDGKGLNQC
jgi:hypothetical protein